MAFCLPTWKPIESWMIVGNDWIRSRSLWLIVCWMNHRLVIFIQNTMRRSWNDEIMTLSLWSPFSSSSLSNLSSKENYTWKGINGIISYMFHPGLSQSEWIDTLDLNRIFCSARCSRIETLGLCIRLSSAPLRIFNALIIDPRYPNSKSFKQLGNGDVTKSDSYFWSFIRPCWVIVWKLNVIILIFS